MKYKVLLPVILFSTSAFAQDHLLLTEVTLTPTTGEYIEIYNPTANAIALDNYYLCDNSTYYLVTAGTQTIGTSDFLVRFPAGSSISSMQTMVIALNGVGFDSVFTVSPDFEIMSQDPAVTDMIAISVSSTSGLTNTGESIILFYWDGLTDLVSDVDLFTAGMPSAANQLTSKTGIAVDGPDGDANASTYANDALTMPFQVGTPGFGFSTKRTSLESTNEVHGGGNGITGDDETSENTAVTWDDSTTFTAPDPGTTVIAGINTNAPQQLMSVYPNPSSGFVKLGLVNSNDQIKTYSVFNSMGDKMFFANTAATANTTVDVTALPPALYFILVETTGGQRAYAKFIKQ